MNKYGQIIVVLVGTALFVSMGLVLTGHSFVVNIPARDAHQVALKPGDTVNPIRDFEISKGKNKIKAYIIIDPALLSSLHPKIPRFRCLKTESEYLIARIRKEWNFIYKASDYSTHTNRFLIFDGDSLIFSSSIELSESGPEGLQSQEYGWVYPLKPGAMIDICSYFEPVYSPIVLL